MKKYFLQIFIIIFYGTTFGQENPVSYEQIAFQFYSDSILKKYPVKNKIFVSKQLSLETQRNFSLECLGIDSTESKNFKDVPLKKYFYKPNSPQLNLQDANRQQFKIRKRLKISTLGSNRKNHIFFALPKFHSDRAIVFLNQEVENYTTTYAIEIDKTGAIINWCVESKGMRLILE